MNFDELYKKYKDNTATEEEKAFVEAEIEKAKSISKILNSEEAPNEEKVVKLSDVDIIKKAKKKFNNKNTIRTIIIVCVAILIIGALLVGGVIATVLISANNSKTVSESEAIEIAKQYALQHEGVENTDSIMVGEVDTDLEVRPNLIDSYFVYDIELSCNGIGYEIVVNAATGNIFGNYYRGTKNSGYDSDKLSGTVDGRYDDDLYDDDDRYDDYYDDDRYDDYYDDYYDDDRYDD